MSDLIKIKKRISSVSSTKKITNAMELIASTKLQRFRNQLLSSNEKETIIKELMEFLVSNKEENTLNEYYDYKDAKKKLYIVFTSKMGLCGSYNNDVASFVKSNIDPNESVLLILGDKGYSLLKDNYEINSDYLSIEITNKERLSDLAKFTLEEFKNANFHSVHLVYTKFYSAFKQEVVSEEIFPLPIVKKENKDIGYAPILDPSLEEIFVQLLPFYITTIYDHALLEAEVSLESKRRIAMKNASDNAEEILDDLRIVFNKKRQEAITNELNDVVIGTFR